ncbi:hypothetical protein NM688_g6281 [Phlebia brevispora]|uniref:Uncharacterized protein n=1 Tax=Phlebia brevispora TaxID=194682 RepID=A0ACC1SHV7_9APHY|nr:hypothetical protein NM688_g6281 [Phlebia brevispora]
MPAGNVALHEACASVDVDNISTIPPFLDTLDELSKIIAANVDIRTQIGASEPSLWPSLRRLWFKTAEAHRFTTDRDDEEVVQLRKLCLSLARFTRNLVAAVPQNQQNAFENEPAIRELSHYYTSFSVMQDPETFLVTRTLTQTLSNLVTANESLMTNLWNTYLQLPEEQLILIRLFAVPDAKTVMSAFVMVLNCLDGSHSRVNHMTSSPSGLRLCISFLDRMASLFEDEEAVDSSQAFEVGYHIFCRMVEHGTVPTLYEDIAVLGEVVTPHQTTLLKLLDSYLQPSNTRKLQLDRQTLKALSAMLVTGFFALSEYAQQSISRTLGASDGDSHSEHGRRQTPRDDPERSTAETSSLNDLDVLLPKVSEALVLVTQCLISLALYSEESLAAYGQSAAGANAPHSQIEGDLVDYVNCSVSRSGNGSIECLVETLRAFDRFLPRITFGKVAPPPVSVPEGGVPRMPQNLAQPGAGTGPMSDPKGFAYLKRDLARLLGILASGRRAVQDRVRACGGLPVVLNLCVVDDRNPSAKAVKRTNGAARPLYSSALHIYRLHEAVR